MRHKAESVLVPHIAYPKVCGINPSYQIGRQLTRPHKWVMFYNKIKYNLTVINCIQKFNSNKIDSETHTYGRRLAPNTDL